MATQYYYKHQLVEISYIFTMQGMRFARIYNQDICLNVRFEELMDNPEAEFKEPFPTMEDAYRYKHGLDFQVTLGETNDK